MICSPVMNYFASAGLEILEKAFAQAKHASRAELAASRSRDFEPRQGVAGKAFGPGPVDAALCFADERIRGGLFKFLALLQVVLEYDRSAARGMGSIKCSGNYGADLWPSAEHKA